MHGKYECKNAHEKQQTTQNKKTSRSNKKTYQEQLEDHEEHYECMKIFEKMQDEYAIDTKLITWLKTQTRTQYFWFFYDFMIFLDFY